MIKKINFLSRADVAADMMRTNVGRHVATYENAMRGLRRLRRLRSGED